MEGFFKNTKLAAGLSVVSNLTLIILKLVAGFISGSISIISEAIHSGSDFLASVIAFYAVHKSDQPADEGHQFGHGKYEDVAGFVEGCLIILASLYIIYEASKKLSGKGSDSLSPNSNFTCSGNFAFATESISSDKSRP